MTQDCEPNSTESNGILNQTLEISTMKNIYFDELLQHSNQNSSQVLCYFSFRMGCSFAGAGGYTTRSGPVGG